MSFYRKSKQITRSNPNSSRFLERRSIINRLAMIDKELSQLVKEFPYEHDRQKASDKLF